MQREYCSLCFAPCDNLSQTLAKDDRESLVQLLPHLDIKTQNESLVGCTNCSTKLRGYLEFKAKFMQTQASLHSFGEEHTSGLVDLRQVYLQNKDNESEISSLEDVVVCRFCLKQTTGAYTPLREDQKELILVTIMMGKCFPGWESGTLSGYDICVHCHKTLEESYNFISSLDVENLVKMEDVVEKMEFEEGLGAKTVLVSNKVEIGGMDVNAVKEEDLFRTENGDDFDLEVKVKAEVVEADGSRNRAVYDESEEVVEITKEVVGEDESLSLFEHDAVDVKTEQDPYERWTSTRLKMYHCEICSYKTKLKFNYNRHVLVHKRPADVTMYKCGACPYETRQKENYDRHLLVHKDPSEVTMYKCEVCSFEAKRKRNYKRHVLLHKHPSEVPMHRCDSCSYETKHKEKYNRHMSKHNPSKATTHKCSVCPYEAKDKRSYNRHMLVHERPTTYKCEGCTYETSRKDCYNQHVLTHDSLAEDATFKCDSCMYETKFIQHYNRHLVVHKAPTMYGCAFCPYKAKLRCNLNKHMLVHKHLSEVTMYKCDVCSYETRYKERYSKHMLVHKSPSEVTMYKCASCTFESRHKRALRRHVATHKSV